jgi:ribosomal protein S18 acetylase RimI-like enzyme
MSDQVHAEPAPGDGMLIRRANETDLAALVGLHREFGEVDAHPFDERRVTAAFEPLLRDDRHGVVWIVEPDDGYAVLTWGWSIEAGGPEAVLDEIYVRPRGSGIGADLLACVLADGRARGLARIFLETESRNVRVRSFYARHGFAIDDSIWMSHDFVDLT